MKRARLMVIQTTETSNSKRSTEMEWSAGGVMQ